MANSIAKAELIDELQSLAGKLQRHPHTADMKDYGAYSPQTYQDRFGSWQAAIEAAGLADLTAPVHDDDDLLAALYAVAPDESTPPTHRQVAAEGTYSPWLYIDRFDSWIEALDAAGFETQSRTDPAHCSATEAELLAALHQIATTINRTPTATEMDSYGDYQSTVYTARFGSWNETLAAAELPSPTASQQATYSREELLTQLRDLAADLGRTPTVDEMNAADGPTALTYQYRFGSWHAALDEAGLEPNQLREHQISETALREELRTLADDLNRTPTRRDMNDHGAYSPTTYARRFGSWNAAVRAVGLTPNAVRQE